MRGFTSRWNHFLAPGTQKEEKMSRTTEIFESLTLTDAERNLLAGGYCPKCKVPIRGHFEPVPKGSAFMRPEIYESMRERNIDSRSGHKNSCELVGLRIK